MEQLRIRSGPAEVLASGTVIAFGHNPIEVTWGEGDSRSGLMLTFADADGPDQAVVGDVEVVGNILNITFVNCNSALGMGSMKPIEIGTYLGKTLYFQYRIHALTEADKLLHYTFYTSGRGADDGTNTDNAADNQGPA